MNGFQNSDLLVITGDGRNFTLKESLVYLGKDGRTYRAPAGATSDGLSTPPATWVLIAPFGHFSDGQWRGWKSGVLHDAAYRKTLQVETPGGNWIMANLDQAGSDALIAEAMESEGVPGEIRVLVFEVLRAAGGKAFREDRQAASGACNLSGGNQALPRP